MRKVFLNKIRELLPLDDRLVFLTVDIGMWMIRDLMEKYPDRVMNFGICEDGMMSMAAGMAKQGMIPVIYGIQPYLIDRALEQIKLDLAYQMNGVKVVGTGAAVDYSKYGYSHYCPEDLGLIKMIPSVNFIAPGTATEFGSLFEQTWHCPEPIFYRISDHPNQVEVPTIYGKAAVIQRGTKATVIAVSTMLDMVTQACSGLDVTILYYTTLEPFDWHTLWLETHSNKILICEPHYEGTLTHDVISALPDRALHIRNVGFPREIFRNYGTYEEKLEYYGLTHERIYDTLRELLESP